MTRGVAVITSIPIGFRIFFAALGGAMIALSSILIVNDRLARRER